MESSKKIEAPASLMKICLIKETQIKALCGGKADSVAGLFGLLAWKHTVAVRNL